MASTVRKGWEVIVGAGLEGTPGTPVALTEYYEIQSENMIIEPDIQDFTGLTGARGQSKTSRREGNVALGGDINVHARQNIIGNWLYWAMGGGNGGAPSLDNGVLPTITLCVDRVVRKVTFSGCKIDTLELSSEANGPLLIHPSMLAMNYVEGAGGSTTPSYDNQVTHPILMHHGLILTVDGSAIELNKLNLTLNNNLDGDHFVNSQFRTVIPETRREIALTLGCDWDLQTMTTRAVWTKFLNGATAELIAKYSDGSNDVTFTLPYVRITAVPAVADGVDPIYPDVTAVADDSGPAVSDALTISGL